MTPPRGKCVWCDRIDFTQEHIIGRQFTKALNIAHPVTQAWGDFILPGNTGEVVLDDRVCLTCNGSWMRKLDNKVMKFLHGPLSSGQRVQVNLRDQAILAVWATKIALLLALRSADLTETYPELVAMGSTYAPDDNFAALYKNLRRPPDGTSVWIGSIDPGEGWPQYASAGVALAAFEAVPPSQILQPVEHGYIEVFSLGSLIFCVNGWALDYKGNRPDVNPQGIVGRNAMAQIWPNTQSVVDWPPVKNLVTQDLERVVQTPADWRQPPQARTRLVRPQKPD
jgi:hypothetical protein